MEKPTDKQIQAIYRLSNSLNISIKYHLSKKEASAYIGELIILVQNRKMQNRILYENYDEDAAGDMYENIGGDYGY